MSDIVLIPERNPDPIHRLGRHVHFDPLSKGFRCPTPDGRPLVSRTWERTTPAYDQGDLGSCTGNGSVGLLATAPFVQPGVTPDEELAVKVYSVATTYDTIDGMYPPSDTGSTVLAAMKAMKVMGVISGYHWCLGLTDALHTLAYSGPLSVGVSWYEGFDSPDINGLVHVAGEVRGGHCFEVLGIDVEEQNVVAINSWGPTWGLGGRFKFSFTDFGRLLAEQGEAATVIVP